MEVLYLKDQDLAHKQICHICCITTSTLSKYLKEYQSGGNRNPKKIGYKGQSSELNQHSLTIEEYLRNSPPRNVAKAAKIIEEITGIKRGLTQIR